MIRLVANVRNGAQAELQTETLPAAAPERLEALQSAVEELEHWLLGGDRKDAGSAAVLTVARAALATARGEAAPQGGSPLLCLPV